MVVFILFFSFLVPNINILLQVSGSISGTIITVIMPVVFYNKAYSETNERSGIQMFNNLILIIGCLVGLIGFYIVCLEIYNG